MKKAISLLLISTNLLFAFDIQSKDLYNETAYITSQCYTKTKDIDGSLHNPCYSCHTKAVEPNFMSDEDLQEEYSFPEYAFTNRWTNLFLDRTKDIARISDNKILTYIKQDNYKKDKEIIIAQKLKNLPKEWDVDNDKQWDGYIPDCEFNFDKEGFDRKSNDEITGWVAYKYRPFLGTFWPTNGSTDDVLIRLPKVFWKDVNGKIDKNIYKQNLQIVEDLIKQTKAHKNYVGLASTKNLKIAPGLYPVGTEFLHSVRYIKPTKNSIKLSPRMKELRYAKKI